MSIVARLHRVVAAVAAHWAPAVLEKTEQEGRPLVGRLELDPEDDVYARLHSVAASIRAERANQLGWRTAIGKCVSY